MVYGSVGDVCRECNFAGSRTAEARCAGVLLVFHIAIGLFCVRVCVDSDGSVFAAFSALLIAPGFQKPVAAYAEMRVA